MRKFFLVITFLMLGGFAGCTVNSLTRSLGGKMTVNLPVGQKLINVTWKDADMWYLTRSMRTGETSETYTFAEKSEFGVLNGQVTIVEH